MPDLCTNAEKRAEAAEGLTAFGGFNLAHVKRELSGLLSLIGRDGIFDQYTLHDSSHVNAMLGHLDWIIPTNTAAQMTPADWLMTVLAIYFHDVGMLVTREEFDLRDESSYPSFRDELFSGRFGVDYRAKVEGLGPDDAERFLYQEFVRHHHPDRAKAWLAGTGGELLGVAENALAAVDELLTPLDRQFRRDLGVVCASHHLDDLANLGKYKVDRSYGQKPEEVCNLQYCSILLRAADLLHITRDRTPSIVFKLVNPTDPVSQEEWAKQEAVRRVCPAPRRLPSGEVQGTAHSGDTVQVHAYFVGAKGFFGLTSYLRYAQAELEKCFQWANFSREKTGAVHEFPWRRIDDSNVEAEKFLPRTFTFRLDQAKILDLLVGHTLYNDANVVVRELLQNALDAVRLQRLVDERDNRPITEGLVNVTFDSVTRALIVEDNGTGMTQDIIEQHLLNVGASRYQQEEFKKEFPTFAPISRFGIGILSTFMVSDEVIILTSHPADDHAREISIRSVHGRYLIRLIDKNSKENELGVHGTRVVLKLRPSAEIEDVLGSVRRWLVLPGEGIRVFVVLDTQDPIEVGYRTLSDAVHELVAYDEGDNGGRIGQARIEVREVFEGALSIAYAVRWAEKPREWRFVESAIGHLMGTCVEGIRVEAHTPGFDSRSVVAVADLHGKDAPRTTVARDGFENTSEYENALRQLHNVYARHAMSEFHELINRKTNSISWAARELMTIVAPLLPGTSNRSEPLKRRVFWDVFDRVPIVLVEKDGDRNCVSVSSLRNEACLWTIHSRFYSWAEGLLQEVPREVSFSAVARTLTDNAFSVHNELILCIARDANTFEARVLAQRSVDFVSAEKATRRVDLRWVPKNDEIVWLEWNHENIRYGQEVWHDVSGQVWTDDLMLPVSGIEYSGCGGEIAVIAFTKSFLNPASPVVAHVVDIVRAYRDAPSDFAKGRVTRALRMLRACLQVKGNYVEKLLTGKAKGLSRNRLEEISKWPSEEIRAFSSVAEITNWEVFNPAESRSEPARRFDFGDPLST